MTPAFKVVKIFLENLWLGRCWDGKIKSSVICKESHVGLDIHRKIIYVDWKEKWSQHRPLRYSRWDRYMFGWRSIYNDRLVFSLITLSKALLRSSKITFSYRRIWKDQCSTWGAGIHMSASLWSHVAAHSIYLA